jgi:hypothetical protein
MTFSIVACDLEEQTWGVAVASKFPAVGAVVPFAQAGAGAVATQSFANTSFGPRGLDLMHRICLPGKPLKDCCRMTRTGNSGRSAWWTQKAVRHTPEADVSPGQAVFQEKATPSRETSLPAEKVVPAMEKAFLKTKGACPTPLCRAAGR